MQEMNRKSKIRDKLRARNEEEKEYNTVSTLVRGIR